MKAVTISLLAVGLSLLAVGLSHTRAQSPPITAAQPCWDNLPCLRQRVLDLKDYREFAEDQLALAKSVARDAQQQLQAAEKRLTTCGEKTP